MSDAGGKRVSGLMLVHHGGCGPPFATVIMDSPLGSIMGMVVKWGAADDGTS